VAKRQPGPPSPSAAAARRQRPLYPKWIEAEDRVITRFARAIVSGRYPNVNQALPDCRRELAPIAPGLQRTDNAIAWRLLCRAYDFGLPRWMHFWTDQERRLLEPHALAVARGECPDAPTAARLVNRAFKQAGLALRHPDESVRDEILVRARALGRAPCSVCFGPEEDRVIDRFSRALVRNEYRYGTAAVADCHRALARAGITRRRSDRALALRINTGARALGWMPKSVSWSASGARIVDRFARALVSGRYPSIVAAARACRPALERAGQLGNRTEGGLRAKLRVRALGMGKAGFRPRWSGEELRILDRFARAIIRGAYPTASAAAKPCRRALKRAGLPIRPRVRAVEDKLHHLALGLRHKRQP
jgi:hypothetical protein